MNAADLFPTHDDLGFENHERRCKPLDQCDEFERVWRLDTNKTGFYADDPYY